MGNSESQLKGLQIEKKAIEVTDYWSMYFGEIPNEDKTKLISIFQGEPIISDNFWNTTSPLEKATKNLMVFRHPCILKYIGSFEKGSLKILSTERCRNLSSVGFQSDIQICLGLKSILSAIIFLVEQANVRHLNISLTSIYVTCDGSWKLAGFEYVYKVNEFTTVLLEKSKCQRYNKSIDVNEVKNKGVGLEQFAFAVLSEEILSRFKDGESSLVKEFISYCTTHLKHSNVQMRPKLSAVLLHPYFNHEIILVHSFLIELPLKSQQEKQSFFTNLIDRLRSFDENMIASQLGELLLSRMLLLDSTAQICVLPFLLRPRTDVIPSLFCISVFSQHILPKIKQVFCVRDAQIRLILLQYFPDYVNLFSKEDLKDNILPQLLLGIKDTNDLLVSTTLRCLADLVTILGATIVIGGNRGRLFADGRPQGISNNITNNHWIEARSITPVLNCVDYTSNSPIPDNVDLSESYTSVEENVSNEILMPERLAPDGEDIRTTSELLEDDAWSDWEEELDDNQRRALANYETSNKTDDDILKISDDDQRENQTNQDLKLQKTEIKDIDELDIKNQITRKKEEIDFFKDMEPIIHKSNVILLENNDKKTIEELTKNSLSELDNIKIDKSLFDIKMSVHELNEDGWGGDESDNNDWGNGV